MIFVLSKVVKYNPFKTIEIIFTANAYISTSNAIKFQNERLVKIIWIIAKFEIIITVSNTYIYSIIFAW